MHPEMPLRCVCLLGVVGWISKDSGGLNETIASE